MKTIVINPKIFRGYDIRGIYGSDFDGKIAFILGKSYVKFLNAYKSVGVRRLLFAHDARPFSPILQDYFISGIQSQDNTIEIHDMGVATTPMHFFALNNFKYDGGVMSTASHNPPEYGGFKLFVQNGNPMSAYNGLTTLRKIAQILTSFDIAHHAIHGKNFISVYYMDAYIDFLVRCAGGKAQRPCTVVVDAGNGTAGLIIDIVARKFGVGLIPLFFEPDGTFPNRSPNPLEPMALEPLKNKVKKMNADFGIAFDGDGDRVIFVDEKGELIQSDKIFALLAERALAKEPAGKVIIPVNASKMVADAVRLHGGEVIVSSVGRTSIIDAMRSHKALLGGEISGHFYFKEFFGGDDGVLAALLMIKIFAQSNGKFSELFTQYGEYVKSDEINMAIGYWPFLVSRLERIYGAWANNMHRIDGITFEFENWWFNIRPSNTEPLVRLVVEAKNKEILEEKIAELKKYIQG